MSESIFSACDRFRRAPTTDVKPSGAWLTTANRNGTVHRVAYAQAAWRTDELRVGARAVCGTPLLKARFHVEPPSDKFCDRCLLDGLKRYHVYRLLDGTGHALYIGHTCDLPRRLTSHCHAQDWWSEVASVDLTEYPSEVHAHDAEVEAIRRDDPIYNRQRYTARLPKAA
jgi:predicted GIY-YIG superfamily endonuclease